MKLLQPDVPMAAEFTRAARGIRPHDDPWVMAYFPVARMNPYQSLLYCRGWTTGFAPVATSLQADLASVSCVLPLGVGGIVHIHWTSGITASAATMDEAATSAMTFIDQLAQIQARGVRVVWTIHNRLPHRCEHPTVELRLRAELAKLADVIHVMTPSTASEVSDLYTLPEDRLLLAPHPSYAGAYATYHERDISRFELGFDHCDFVAGAIGSIQPYKGIDTLLDAVPSAAKANPRLRVVVAGIPGKDAISKELVGRLKRTETVITVPAKLDDQNLARITSALDVMVLPYRATLNSGAAALALSYGIPIIAPRIGSFRDYIQRGYCLGYDPDDPRGLVRALGEAPDWATKVDRTAMRNEMASTAAPTVSTQFFADLRKLLHQS